MNLDFEEQDLSNKSKNQNNKIKEMFDEIE